MKPESLTQVARWATAVVALVAFTISFISVGHVSSESTLGWAGWGVPAIVEGGIVAVSCARIFAELRGKRGATWMLGIISVGYVALAVVFNLMHLSGTLSGVIVAVAAPVTLFIAAETFLWMTKVQMEPVENISKRRKRFWSIINRHRAMTNAVRRMSEHIETHAEDAKTLTEAIDRLTAENQRLTIACNDATRKNEALVSRNSQLEKVYHQWSFIDKLPTFTAPLLTAIAKDELNDDKVLAKFSEEHGVAVTSLKRTVSLFRRTI